MVIKVLNLNKCLKKFGDISDIDIMPAIKDATRKVQAEAKNRAPRSDFHPAPKVDAPVTGDLKRSIKTKYDPRAKVGIVFTNLEYAPYQEFGTTRVVARPFMQPAMAQLNDEIQADIQDYIRKELDKKL